MPVINCNLSGINEYIPSIDNPWNKEKILHLHNRIGYGISHIGVENALIQNPSLYIDGLIDEAFNAAIPADPYFANWTIDDYYDTGEERYEHYSLIVEDFLVSKFTEGLRSKMIMFWHNHFVTQWPTYECPPYLWQYYKTLMQYSLGNFKDFLKEIGKCGAMLEFLNGNSNEASDPNENYARELFELFSLGQNNGYTENDIINAAKSLTGWRADGWQCTPVVFDNYYYDAGIKTIFGQTDTYDYDQLHDLIFTERTNECATYICAKLYKHFVYEEPNEEIISEMAATFVNNDFEITPVVRQLLKSEHFFDASIIGAKIKSPVENFISVHVLSDISPDELASWILGSIRYYSYELGQDIFTPVDVAGWPGHRSWINESTLTNRWELTRNQVFSFTEEGRAKLLNMAVSLTSNSSDPYIITDAFIKHYLSFELSSSSYQAAVDTFKGDVPENYYEDGIWNLNFSGADWQCVSLVNFLVTLPEFQLY